MMEIIGWICFALVVFILVVLGVLKHSLWIHKLEEFESVENAEHLPSVKDRLKEW